MKTLGQIAHDAYHQSHGDGPFDWEHVSTKDKEAWEATAQAVVDENMRQKALAYYDDSSGYFNPLQET